MMSDSIYVLLLVSEFQWRGWCGCRGASLAKGLGGIWRTGPRSAARSCSPGRQKWAWEIMGIDTDDTVTWNAKKFAQLCFQHLDSGKRLEAPAQIYLNILKSITVNPYLCVKCQSICVLYSVLCHSLPASFHIFHARQVQLL